MSGAKRLKHFCRTAPLSKVPRKWTDTPHCSGGHAFAVLRLKLINYCWSRCI